LIPKLIIILFLLVILYTLGSAFWYLVHDKGEGDRTVKRLSWRVGLSLALFAMLYVFHLMGWIQPSTPGPIGLKPPAAEAPER
jgi:succinate dehydrogenase/fumarate reductase cytochrome b subunit